MRRPAGTWRQTSSSTGNLVYARDPKDEPYINLARAAKARYLVSRDADLLNIATAVDSDASRIRKECPELEIVDPVTFLVAMKRISSIR